MGCLVTLVHKVLEGHVSCFLELDVILEGFSDELVHAGFEFEQQLSKLEWILAVLFVVDDVRALLHDVGVHLIDNKLERLLNSCIHVVHHGELVNFALVEHVLTSRLHVGELFSLIFDNFLENDVDDAFFCLWLQEVVSV
jgi:hypothetical protein